MKRSKKTTQIKCMLPKLKKCSVPAAAAAKSWSDLDLNLLGEIKKRLFWADHIRFGGVCKNWLAAQHEKRAGDVLPWLFMLNWEDEDINMVSCSLYQPTSSLAPLNLSHPTISRSINLGQFIDLSRASFHMPYIYLDGCLFISMYDLEFTCSYYLLYSIPTNKAIALPQFYHPIVPMESDFCMFQALSDNPMSPHCVFLALFVSSYHEWSIGIFRHGDTHWTTTNFTFGDSIGCYPFVKDVVFIRGIFYFLCYNGRLASYDIASAELKVEIFSTRIDYGGIDKFFELDGELMLLYYDRNSRKYLLTNYDWSNKVWVPVNSLGDRSLFLSKYSVYVDAINYFGVSANKIYIQRDGICCAYSLENGELLKSTSSGLRIWDGLSGLSPSSLWVEPHDFLLQKVGYQPTEDDGGRIQWWYAS